MVRIAEGEAYERVDGRWLCECGQEARDHPRVRGFTEMGEPVDFVRLCDLRLAKL